MPPFTKSSSREPIGLDIDGNYLAAVEAHAGRVGRAATADLPSGLVTDGEVSDREGLAAALKEFFKAHDLPRDVRLGVANQQIVLRQIELPVIDDPRERELAIQFQAADAIAMPLQEAILDHQMIARVEGPDGTQRMRIVVVAARASMVEGFVDAAKDSGLKPVGVDLDAFALVRALCDAQADDAPGARVYCHLAGVTNLAIALGEICLFTRPLSSDWSDDSDQAAARLADQIRLSIDYYMAQPEAKYVADAVVSGPGAQRDGFAEELSGMLGLPVTVASPLGRLDGSGLARGEDPHRYTVAAGLAMGG